MELSAVYLLATSICILQTGSASDSLDTWTLQNQSVTTNALGGVTYGNGLFVAVGLDGRILTSPDGINWTPGDSGVTNGLVAVTYGNGRYVAVGRDVFAKIVSSPDGVNWSQQDYIAGRSAWLAGIAYGNGHFVAVGANGTICDPAKSFPWATSP